MLIVNSEDKRMAQDHRLVGKPSTNNGSLPVMIYDHCKLPKTSENIWHAQMAGWPKILTYDGRVIQSNDDEGTDPSEKSRHALLVRG